MDCERAREQIDLRLQECVLVPCRISADLSPAADSEMQGRDWSDLDAHLARCADCSVAWLDALRAQNLLGKLAGDAPTSEEVESMWTAIQAGGSAQAMAEAAQRGVQQLSEKAATVGRRRWGVVWRFAAAGAAVAAVLLIAFQLGSLRYAPTGEMVAVAAKAPALLAEEEQDSIGRAVADAGDRPEIRRKRGIEVGVPVLSEAVQQQLNALGYADANGATAKAPEQLERFGRYAVGDVIVGQPFVSPSADQAAANGQAGMFDFENLDSISLGYQVPFGLGDTRASRRGFAASKADDEREVTANAKPVMRAPPEAPAILGAEVLRGARAVTAGDESRWGDGTATDEKYIGYSLGSERLQRGWEAAGPDRLGEESFAVELEYGPANPTRTGVEPQAPGQEGVPVDAAGAEDAPAEPIAQKAVASPPQPRPRVIKTGQLAVEVDDYESAVARVEGIVRQHGAFIANGSTQETSGGALLGQIVIRVHPEGFEALFAALKSVGRIESENAKAADVTAEYVDLEARIASLQITEARLQELVKSKSFIDKISALLEVERELTRVRSQIEQYQGQLRVMADRIAMSTITMTLREPARTVPSASMSVEVPVLEEAADALGSALTTLGGRLTSGKTSKRDDGTLKGDYQLQVSLARFGELLDAVDGMGRVEQRKVKDRQFGDADAPWAQRVQCQLALVLYERAQSLPAGTVRIEVEAVAPAVEKLDDVLTASGGAVASSSTTRRDDGSQVGELKLRVPAGRFGELISGLDTLGRITARQVAGESGRIVGGAASVPCEVSLTLAERPREVPTGHMSVEVDDFGPARAALSSLVAEKGVQVLASASNQRTDGTWVGAFRLGIKAGDMEAVVSRLESLGRVQSRQISGLGLGDLSRMDPDALGAINVSLAEKPAINPAPEKAGDSIRDYLHDGLAGLYTSLGFILYGLVVMAPWLIVVVLAALLVVRVLRQRRKAETLKR